MKFFKFPKKDNESIPKQQEAISNGIKIREDGKIEYYDNWELHREDGPAVIHPDGREEYFHRNAFHRVGGPAQIDKTGTAVFYINGSLHNYFGPAIIKNDGTLEYWELGLRHRENGPAMLNIAGKHLRFREISYLTNIVNAYYLNGQLHREDGPAVLYSDGSKNYYRNGKLHREDNKPAVVDYSNPSKPFLQYYKDGGQHRTNGPAFINSDGTRFFFYKGKEHRDGDKPAIIQLDGTIEYKKFGKLHRLDGPALISPNSKIWMQNNLKHNLKDPAVISKRNNNKKVKQWWCFGIHYNDLQNFKNTFKLSDEEYNALLEMDFAESYKFITKREEELLKSK